MIMTLDNYNPERLIIVVGYPKSGSSWLCRLLGTVLDSPIGGLGVAKPISTEGADRPGAYYIAQLHLHPVSCESRVGVVNAWDFNINAWNGENIIHIIRDPRDVAVSVKYYWKMESLDRAIHSMFGCENSPLANHGIWDQYVNSWSPPPFVNTINRFYESLSFNPVFELTYILDFFGIKVEKDKIEQAVEKETFDNRLARVQAEGDGMAWGKPTQLLLMRKGIVGDWRNHFTRKDAELLWKYAGETMFRFGYALDDSWVDKCPEKLP